LVIMSKKHPIENSNLQLPVSKQTASGVAGAVVGGVIGGPIGAVVGGVAGTIMANRAARGKSILPKGVVKKAKTALSSARKALPTAKAAQVRSAKAKRSAARPNKKSNSRAGRVTKKGK
jgi:hypothetical protein